MNIMSGLEKVSKDEEDAAVAFATFAVESQKNF